MHVYVKKTEGGLGQVDVGEEKDSSNWFVLSIVHDVFEYGCVCDKAYRCGGAMTAFRCPVSPAFAALCK